MVIKGAYKWQRKSVEFFWILPSREKTEELSSSLLINSCSSKVLNPYLIFSLNMELIEFNLNDYLLNVELLWTILFTAFTLIIDKQ